MTVWRNNPLYVPKSSLYFNRLYISRINPNAAKFDIKSLPWVITDDYNAAKAKWPAKGDVDNPWYNKNGGNPNDPAAQAAGYRYQMRLVNTEDVIDVFVGADTPNLDLKFKYFCHGYALGTFNVTTQKGYSVYSSSMELVLKNPSLFAPITGALPVVEERDGILSLKKRKVVDKEALSQLKVLPGDILTFWSSYKGIKLCDHSAVIREPVFSNGTLSGRTTCMSKNGPQPLKETTLCELFRAYPHTGTLKIYRRVKAPVTLTSAQLKTFDDTVKGLEEAAMSTPDGPDGFLWPDEAEVFDKGIKLLQEAAWSIPDEDLETFEEYPLPKQ